MSSSDLAVGQTAFTIVPHNTTKFVRRARAFYVGVGGDGGNHAIKLFLGRIYGLVHIARSLSPPANSSIWSSSCETNRGRTNHVDPSHHYRPGLYR